MANVKIDLSGFEESEKLRFEGVGVRNVHRMFGESMAMIAKVTLNMMLLNVGKVRRQQLAEEAEVAYRNMVSLARTETFVIDGTNYLKRYLQAFEGYCEGVGISFAEGAMLQILEEAGCQTVTVQDKETGELRMIHTEEDQGTDGTKTAENYFYRWVEMVIDGREIGFFGYPGLCSFGAAFGINKNTGLVQAVDDLYIKEVHSRGILWANAVAFMTLDAGDLHLAHEIVKRIRLLPGEKFTGGYAIHLLMPGETPKYRSIEFGGDKIAWTKPVEMEDRLVTAQSNYALDKTIQKYTVTWPPGEGERWRQEDAEVYVEMRERYYRLEKLGASADWLKKDEAQTIATGLELLARPEGDIGRNWSDEGKEIYYYTSLPSRWVAAHLVAYVNRDEVTVYIGKLLPKPIRGREYSLRVRKDYKYAKNRLWEMAEKERRIRNKKPIF